MIYTSTTIRAQRKAVVDALIACGRIGAYSDDRCVAVAERICQRIGERPYSLIEDGQSYATAWAAESALPAVLQQAIDAVDPANYSGDDDSESATLWIDVEVRDAITGDLAESTTVTVEPAEPDCAEGHEHAWDSPHEVVGGLEENPGVWGHGGGVIVREVCRHCGCYRRTDTWAQRRDTGEQGLTSVTYEDADESSLEYVERMAAESADA